MRALHSRQRHHLGVIALAIAAAVTSARVASAQEQVIGLLTLPGLFGNGPCERVSSDQIRLYPSPSDNRIVGTIRVDQPWTRHPQGGCDGLEVNVHRSGPERGQRRGDQRGDDDVQPLPTREFGYEMPAAIVLDRRERWYRIRLADGAAWVHDPSHAEFLPLVSLLTDQLTYLTEEWDGRLAAIAGGPMRGTARADLSESPVRVTGTRRVGPNVWIAIDVLDVSPCGTEPTQSPKVTSRGWVPAHAPNGEPMVWFYSRGC